MKLPVLLALCVNVAASGCTARVSHEQTAKSSAERSTTIVEVAPLDSPSPVPAEPLPDPLPPFINQEGIGNRIVFGDVAHSHLHSHEAPKPLSVRVDVRVEVDVVDERERRRRLVEQRLRELLDRR